MSIVRRARGRRSRRSRLLAALLPLALLVATMSVVPSAAQAQTPSVDEVHEYLRGVPGLKAGQLDVALDAVGDVDGADAEWAASGLIEVPSKLRTWLKELVASEYGWGTLPPKGTPVLIVLVKLADPPTLDGDQTAVVHLGLAGGGDLTVPGRQQDLASGTRLLHSGGVWFDDGRLFPQNGSSPVTADGVAWFAEMAAGAGGIVMPDGVMVMVVPVDKWARHHRITVEGTKPFADPPVPPTRDVVYAPGGSQFQRFRDGLDLSSVACVRTSAAPLSDGRRQVELHIQALGDFSAEELAKLQLETYDAEKQLLDTVEGLWTRIPAMGLYRALFTIDDPDARSAAVAPPEGNVPKPNASPLQRIGLALRTGLFGIDSVGDALGTPECGQLESNADICGPQVVAALASADLFDGAAGRLVATPGVARSGAVTCEVTLDGEPVATLLQDSLPTTSRNEFDNVVETAGCAAVGLTSLREGALVSCDSFVALLWRQAIPALEWAQVDDGIGVIQKIVLYRPLHRGPAGSGAEPQDAELPRVMAPVVDAMIAAAEQAGFDLAVQQPAEVG